LAKIVDQQPTLALLYHQLEFITGSGSLNRQSNTFFTQTSLSTQTRPRSTAARI